MLQKELDGKNEQIAAQTRQLEAKDRQIEQLTAALENTTSSLQAAQALHAGTMQKQLQSPEPSDVDVPGDVGADVEPADARPRGLFGLFKRRDK